MTHLQVKDVPTPVHAELRRRAGLRGVSLRDYLYALVMRDLAFPTREEWLARVQELEPVKLDRPAADLIAEARAERDHEFDERH